MKIRKLPDSRRIITIGDVHGCLEELKQLMSLVGIPPDDQVVFIGDYIDRGDDSKGVVDFIINLKKQYPGQINCLRGNHEDMFIHFLGLGDGHHGNSFLRNGGSFTLQEYGLNLDHLYALTDEEIQERVGKEHIDFYQSLEHILYTDEYIFVHAGITRSKKLEEQHPEDVVWVRYWETDIQPEEFDPFYNDKTVVYGHTPHNLLKPEVIEPYKTINIDGGCVYAKRGKENCSLISVCFYTNTNKMEYYVIPKDPGK